MKTISDFSLLVQHILLHIYNVQTYTDIDYLCILQKPDCMFQQVMEEKNLPVLVAV